MAAESSEIPRQAPSGIAWFDLDGTLLAWDCQLLFRHYVLRREPWRAVFLPMFLLLLPLAPLLGAGRMKRVFLAFLFGMPAATLERHCRGFAASIRPRLFAEVLAELERHRAAGDWLILASASPDFYLSEIGRELGFDLILGTRVQPGGLLPRLQNHKGEAKVRRLRETLPPAWFENGILVGSHGYSDSAADLPMLRICAAATVINPSPKLAALAAARGWRILRPPRPWRGQADRAVRMLALLTGLGRDPAA